MIILQGMENLGELTPPEIQYRQQRQLQENERLACQAKVKGLVVVRVAEESKLPHINYSS